MVAMLEDSCEHCEEACAEPTSSDAENKDEEKQQAQDSEGVECLGALVVVMSVRLTNYFLTTDCAHTLVGFVR
ncbi:hypothetical protein EVJ58_g9026 [Rhodofomes roseus]|uniref:Uncharacterized protein n=1 Tax=Rhodofomes roseus TaxID=34475 RepID=A0A4Y9XWH9_9APHY|nr:hypothetical protein EVJ58_g9026 [Rhodofomes roseus]